MLAAAGGGLLVWHRANSVGDRPSNSPTGEPVESAADQAKEAEAEAKRAAAVEFQLDRDRVYSRGSYEALVVAAAPYRSVAEHAEQTITPVRLRAVELDAFSDDIYWRDGDLVILGEQDGLLVGFTHRFVVDRSYPANSLNGDGFGSAEWGRHSLVLGDDRIDLRRLSRHERPSRSADHVSWEPIDEHDAVVLYIPPTLRALAELPRLGIPEPAEVVRKAVRDSSKLFGLDFVLVSPQAFDALRAGASSELLTLQVFLAGVALGALFFAPLLGQLAAGVTISDATLAQTGRRVLAKALPKLVELTGRAMLEDRGLRGTDGVALSLLGVELPVEADHLALVGEFLAALLPHGEGQYVPYSGQRVHGGQLFVPEQRMNVNAELLARGLAKLDLGNLDLLREHPQLVEAALDALDARRNLAAHWADDEAYRGMIAMLQRG